MPTPSSVRLRFGYASGALVTGAFTTLPGLLLLPYLTDTLGVGAALAGLVVLVPKAWAVLLTPLAGRAGDRTHAARGSRRRHILTGGLGAAAGFAAMLAGVADGPAGVAWTGLGFLLTATAFAYFQAAYAALPADLADSARERTRLVGGRVAGIAVAALTVGSAGPAIVDAGGGSLGGHRLAGLFGAAVMAAGALAVAFGAARTPPTTPPAPHTAEPPSPPTAAPTAPPRTAHRAPAPRRLALLRELPAFAALLHTTALQTAATGCLLAAGPYFAAHILHDPGLTPVLVAAFVAPNLLVVPLWTRFAARRGHRTALRAAGALFAGGCLLLTAAPALPAPYVPAVLLLVGAGHAGQLLFLYAMLAETAAHDSARTGRNRVGALSGLFSSAEALGIAAGPFLVALVALQPFGYTPSTTGQAAPQSATAQAGVLAAMTLLPAALTAAALLLLHARRPRTPAPAAAHTAGELAQPRL
ncbi:MFS transporter [Streptomyces sp. NPDC020597]|uniref:MFS transporter n=1 Tax=unclassified Streptomyces TaxID=2593676 RepID=UPI00378A5C43